MSAAAPTVVVCAAHPGVAELFAAALRPFCANVTIEVGTSTTSLRYAPDVPSVLVCGLAQRLGPFRFVPEPDPTVPPGTVVVSLAEPEDYQPVRLTLRTDCPAYAERLLSALGPYLRGAPAVHPIKPGEDHGVTFGGANAQFRAIARLAAAPYAVLPPEREEWEEEDLDLWVNMRGSATRAVPVRIESDDPEASAQLAAILGSAGFSDVRVGPLSAAASRARRFGVVPGALGCRPGDPALARLQGEFERFLAHRGVDAARFPVVLSSGDGGAALRPVASEGEGELEGLTARVILPFAQWSREELSPWSGDHPSRFTVHVRTDDPAAGSRLRAGLMAAGFLRVRLKPLADEDEGVSVVAGDLLSQPASLAALLGALTASFPGRDWAPNPAPDLENRVDIVLPLLVTDEARERAARARHARFAVTVHTRPGVGEDRLAAIKAGLRAAGFARVSHALSTEVEQPTVRYGGADPRTLDALCAAVAELGVEVVEREQAWPPRDLDIYLMLPEGRAASVAAPTRNDAFDAWNEARPRAARAPFLAVEGSCLRVGTVRLPLAGVAMAGPLPGFEHYVLDRSTAETLEHLALAVLRREPALLEGATSTSKTSAVQYLGAALGQPVVRVNLNAQTDTSELLGRYLPDPSATGRAAWRWVDGRVVRAMRDGAWLVLDELNLAEPAILERLNPLVEADPSLVLTEHDGECFGRHGTPIHPNFRVFATMNPASYGGRTALSPAFRDRFLAFRQVPSPSETDLHTMLERLVLGRGANFSLGAHAWTLPAAPPTLPWAGPKRAVTGVLRQLARLWSSLQGLAADGTPDASGREPAVFTRRGLLALVAAVHADTQAKLGLDAALRAALQRYVVARVAGDAERLALAHVLDASLLGPGQWRVGGTLGPPPPPVPPPVPDTDVPFYLHPGGLR